ncbi:hypothetical protein L596_005670 [Steinernema carpocapsae]|uniref:Uncharacterized protein n=1 Tax=Steinernema carpocapsae TaxID=34508 RepID=A0A4U8V016_STECR|nr:hypothetical protein L596_005670 [Steinernema carpocapsae]
MDAANSERSGRSSTFSIATRPDKAKEIMPPAMHPMQQHPQQAQSATSPTTSPLGACEDETQQSKKEYSGRRNRASLTHSV